jgi:hypothetical protein
MQHNLKAKFIYLTKTIFIGVFILTFLNDLQAQKTRKNAAKKEFTFVKDQVYLVKLRNESTIIGTYQGLEGTLHTFKSDISQLQVAASDMESVKEVSSDRIKNGKYWFPNPHASRYIFAPSALSLKKDEHYFQSIYGLYNSYNYGVTDHFTVGAGTEIISVINGNAPILVVTPKFGGYKVADMWHLGAGAIAAYSFEAQEILGVGYGVATYGDEDSNITIGAGLGLSPDAYTLPVATLSGMTRLSKNIGLITENWLLYNEEAVFLFSYGVRFMGERISVDLAFINNKDIAQTSIPIGIPLVEFAFKF